MRGNAAGRFSTPPQGVILHGTRSGEPYDTYQEFEATVNWVRSGAAGLGWHATIGDDEIAIHLQPDEWGWNARGASSQYLAVEFAQAGSDDEITDGQVRAFCWWLGRVRLRWPRLPRAALIAHSELPEGIADGKTDVYPRWDERLPRLRWRIAARLSELGLA